MKRIAILCTCIAVVVACATSPTGRRQLMLISEGQAISASAQQYTAMMQKLRSEGKIEAGTAVTRRVATITERLAAQAVQMRPDSRSWNWSVQVIDEPETINAWAMAGGKMAIYTGLIDKLDATDDEIAQVMGHEIAHALANHTAERMSTALATQLGLAGLAIATDTSGPGLAAASAAAALAITLPNSRASEAEADEIGIELAARAGYHPDAAVTLWQKMAKAGGNGPPQFLSTHPSPANRQAKLKALAPKVMPYYERPGPRPTHPVSTGVPAAAN